MTIVKHWMIAAALCAASTAALAQAQYYAEGVSLSRGFSQSVRYSASAPHASPVRLNLVGNEPGLTGQIQFVSTPAPSVWVQLTAQSKGGLGAWLDYSFDVTGPANTFVPIAYTAHFNLSPANPQAAAYAELYVETYAVGSNLSDYVYGGVNCLQACDAWSETGSALSTIAAHYDGMGANAGGGMNANGTFSGVVMAPTNANGLGVGNVYLYASVRDNGAQVVNNSSWAFIDPHFEVLPSYQADHSGAGIQILAGVGNQSGVMPVPEPGAALLMLGGLAGLAGLCWAGRMGRPVKGSRRV